MPQFKYFGFEGKWDSMLRWGEWLEGARPQVKLGWLDMLRCYTTTPISRTKIKEIFYLYLIISLFILIIVTFNINFYRSEAWPNS